MSAKWDRRSERLGPRSPRPLTSRETQIAALVGLALSEKEIAVVLGISRKTVNDHTRSLHRKTRTSSRAHLVRWVILMLS